MTNERVRAAQVEEKRRGGARDREDERLGELLADGALDLREMHAISSTLDSRRCRGTQERRRSERTLASVSKSTEAVASSMTMMRLFRSSARARASSCRCPACVRREGESDSATRGRTTRSKGKPTHREVVAARADLALERDAHPARADLLRREPGRDGDGGAALARLRRRAVGERRRRVPCDALAGRRGEDPAIAGLGRCRRRVDRRRARMRRRARRHSRGRRSRGGRGVDEADTVEHLEAGGVGVVAERVEVGADGPREEDCGERRVSLGALAERNWKGTHRPLAG